MSGRGKELKGQTLVLPGSRSGASTIVTRLSYDSAFNVQFIGEARYGSPELETNWYIEKLSYDSAFNLLTVETAQNQRLLGTTTDSLSGTTITLPDTTLVFDIHPNDKFNEIPITSISGRVLTLASPSPTVALNTVVITLENYITKDFNKRAWGIRELYIYA